MYKIAIATIAASLLIGASYQQNSGVSCEYCLSQDMTYCDIGYYGGTCQNSEVTACTLQWNGTANLQNCLSNIPSVTLDLGAVQTGNIMLNQTMPDGKNQLAIIQVASSFLNLTLMPGGRISVKLTNSGSNTVQVQIPGNNNFYADYSTNNKVFYKSNYTSTYSPNPIVAFAPNTTTYLYYSNLDSSLNNDQLNFTGATLKGSGAAWIGASAVVVAVIAASFY